MSEELNQKQLGEVDNRTRKMEERIGELESALRDMEKAMMIMAKVTNRAGMNDLRSQVIEEAVVRYMAGYEVGDFTKEVEQATNGTAKGPKDFKYLVKNKDFDQERFNGIMEEVTKILLDTAKKAAQTEMANARATQSTEPASNIVQFPKKIIL